MKVQVAIFVSIVWLVRMALLVKAQDRRERYR